MADEKKISGLTEVTNASSIDEFVVVNKAVTEGADASASGQTSKITLGNLRTSILSGGSSGGGIQLGGSSPELIFNDSQGERGSLLFNDGNLEFWSNYTGEDRPAGNAINHFTITKSGNVGIGTDNPVVKLDVEETSSGTNFRVGGTGLGGEFQVNNAGSDIYLVGRGEGSNDDKIMLHTNGDSFLTGGNVGIGTSSPEEALHIKGDNARMFIASDDYNVAVLGRRAEEDLDDGYLALYSEGTRTVSVDSKGPTFFMGGNFGLGTETPSASLDIVTKSLVDDGKPEGRILGSTPAIRINGWSNFGTTHGGHYPYWGFSMYSTHNTHDDANTTGFSRTCSITKGSSQVFHDSPAEEIVAGVQFSGAGIPNGASVKEVIDENNFTFTRVMPSGDERTIFATETNAAATLTFNDETTSGKFKSYHPSVRGSLICNYGHSIVFSSADPDTEEANGLDGSYVEHMRINTVNGYIGIKQPNPTCALHIKGDTNSSSQIRLCNTYRGSDGSYDNIADFAITAMHGDKPRLAIRDQKGGDTKELLSVNLDGNVGIGGDLELRPNNYVHSRISTYHGKSSEDEHMWKTTELRMGAVTDDENTTGTDDGAFVFSTATNVHTGGELREAMRINHTGMVSFGSKYQNDISGTVNIGSNDGRVVPTLHFHRNEVPVADKAWLGTMAWQGKQPDGTMETGARIYCKVDGTPTDSANSMPTSMIFQTNNSSTASLADRMTIGADGVVTISYKLVCPTVTSSGLDAKDLENVRVTEANALEKLNELVVSDFEKDGVAKTGIVAQNMQKILPNSVSGGEEYEAVVEPAKGMVVANHGDEKIEYVYENDTTIEAYEAEHGELPVDAKFVETDAEKTETRNHPLATSNDELVAMLVKAVQELSAKNDELSAKNDELSAKVDELSK